MSTSFVSVLTSSDSVLTLSDSVLTLSVLGSSASLSAIRMFAVTALSLALSFPTAALDSEEETALLAWLGCWQPIDENEDDSLESPGDHRLVCIEWSDPQEALTRTLIVNNQIVAERTLYGDGSRRHVRDGDCEGWESAHRSADGRRLYQRLEMACESAKHRTLTGASMISSANRWIEIQAAHFDREREISVREYRAVSANTVRLPGEVPVAVTTARLNAREALTPDDVIEALEHVEPAVVEAMLQEREQGFSMNSQLLVRLDDAGVPSGVIDLMVALSYPNYFTVEDDIIARKSTRVVGYPSPWCSHYAFGYRSCYPYYPYYPYRHYYGYYPGGPIVTPPRPSGGSVVSGRGYTRVRLTESPPGGLGSLFGNVASGEGGYSAGGGGSPFSTRSNSASSSANDSGYSGGGSGSTRRAVPR